MADIDSLLFVELSPKNSTRERELLRSQALSHASRISHKRSQMSLGKAQHRQKETTVVRRSVKASLERTSSKSPVRIDHAQGRTRDQKESVMYANTSNQRFPSPERLKREAASSPSLSTIGLDLICSPLVTLTACERMVLDYFRVGWLPSVDRFPPGCQVAMFTPLLPEDTIMGTELVTRALQAPSQLHIYALLSSAVSRMQFVHQISPPERYAKETYFGKAIQALRLHLMTELQITDQLIMDVGLLALTELYNKVAVRSNVYWQLITQMVCARGGLSSIDPFVAYSCVGVDYLIAAGTFTPPAFNLLANPALLGLKVVGTEQTETLVTTAVADLHPRLRILCQQSMILTQVIGAIHSLGISVVISTMNYISKHNETIYRLLAGTATPRSNPPVSNRHVRQAASADGLLVRVRSLAFSVWLWHISHDASAEEVVPPFNLSKQISEMSTFLNSALCMFQNTDWAVRDRLVVWIAALGTLVTKKSEEKATYNLRFVQFSNKLNISDISEMQKTLSFYPPFERIDNHWLNRLWHVFKFAGM